MKTQEEMECLECGKGRLVPAIVDLTGYRHDEAFTVRAHGLECNACGFRTIDSDHTEEFTKLISDAYREKYGFLTGNQIRAARRRLRMSQDEFARYLKVGPASVNRWENGQIQDEAMNELLLLKTDPSVAKQNYQSVAMISGTDALVYYFDTADIIVPVAETQFRKPRSAYGPNVFQVAEVYAPLC
jgi:putative zinc finger/helix-turn-helix YgiT family protein